MQRQRTHTSEHSGLAVVLGWIVGVTFSIWAWPHVDPLIRWFLAASIHTIGKDIAAFLYLLAPFALFLLTLWVSMFVVDEVIIHNFLRDRTEEDIKTFFNGKKGWSVPWYVWVVALMFLIGALEGKT